MAAPECERERKRRDRGRERDAVSAGREKGRERRAQSEERPPPPPPPPPLQDYNTLEVARRAERLSRARRPQYGKRRRGAPRALPPDENEECQNGERNLSPLPHLDINTLYRQHYIENCLDLASLHRQLDRSEPTRSHSHDKKLDKIKKKVSYLKKSIALYESEFEEKNGHPLTPVDRATDVQLTRMMDALRKLQAEKRCIKSDPAEYLLQQQRLRQQKERDEKLDAALDSDKPMPELVSDIEEWLAGCRRQVGWSLVEEKACVQRALLLLERARGRPPSHSAERGAARHLYDRYRKVKRALAAYAHNNLDQVNNELATIHEHEAMLFSSVDSSSDSQDKPETTSPQGASETPLQSPPARETEEMPSSTSSARSNEEAAFTDQFRSEGLHCLTLSELNTVLADAKQQKAILQRIIKEYELNFKLQNFRKIQHEDKKDREDDYIRYKAIKARIKLVNALINKKKTAT